MDDNPPNVDARLDEALARIDVLEHVVGKISEALLDAIPPAKPALRVVGRDGS